MNSERLLDGDIVMLYHLYKSNDMATNEIEKIIKVGDTFRVHEIDKDGMVVFIYFIESDDAFNDFLEDNGINSAKAVPIGIAKTIRFKYSQVGLFKRPLKNHFRVLGLRLRDWIVRLPKSADQMI